MKSVYYDVNILIQEADTSLAADGELVDEQLSSAVASDEEDYAFMEVKNIPIILVTYFT